jgi:nucleolysin TIA-1/TIAR
MSPHGKNSQHAHDFSMTNVNTQGAPNTQQFQPNSAGFGGPNQMPFQQVPNSAGGYGRGNQGQQQQWSPPSAGGYGNNNFGGYQG